MRNLWVGVALLSGLALLSDTGSVSAAPSPRSGDTGVLVAVVPAEGEPDKWEVGFRAYDLASGELLATPVVRASSSSPTTLHVGNPHTGESLKIEIRVERQRQSGH
jgi:hypothetical protein